MNHTPVQPAGSDEITPAGCLVIVLFAAVLALLLQLAELYDSYTPGVAMEAAGVPPRPPWSFVGMVDGEWIICDFHRTGPSYVVFRLHCAWTLVPNIAVAAATGLLLPAAFRKGRATGVCAVLRLRPPCHARALSRMRHGGAGPSARRS
jgi:hypothetical protein